MYFYHAIAALNYTEGRSCRPCPYRIPICWWQLLGSEVDGPQKGRGESFSMDPNGQVAMVP